jgi:hypothetical protein
MKLPPHPQRNDDQQTAAGINWGAVAVIAIVIAVAVVLVILHLSGIVGPAAD